MATVDLDLALLARAVEEFYTTEDDQRRIQINAELCKFKSAFSCETTLSSCFLLLARTNSANVQYFGALSLYDTIRKRWEEIVADPVLTEQVKAFLVESLTSGASVQSQSLTNKLSSSLALLALYSMPDVWSTPVQDLTALWAATPELLLRVLAELAAEFPNIRMPLTQRSVLKTELHRVSEDMIRILLTVLPVASSAPSLLNAAVECVEQWLHLPGSNLRQWTSLLSLVFSAVRDDSTALSNLLSILSSNEDLVHEEQLVQSILEYIVCFLCERIREDLKQDATSEDIADLINSMCSLCQSVMSVITRMATSSAHSLSLLTALCEFLLELSSYPGRFPVEEKISELPADFWICLRDEIATFNRSSNVESETLSMAVRDVYAKLLRGSIDKLKCPPHNVLMNWSGEEQEQLISYRKYRTEDVVSTYRMLGGTTLTFLNEQLVISLQQQDINRTESVLFAWEQVADDLTGEDYPQICECLKIAENMLPEDLPGVDESRLANTLMRLLYALSHLLSYHQESASLESLVVRLSLQHLANPAVREEALRTITVITGDRPAWLLEQSEPILQQCFAVFQNEDAVDAQRLVALRCIGYVLSLRAPDQIMEVLGSVLHPYVASLGEGDVQESESDMENEASSARSTSRSGYLVVGRRGFQIAIFSCLFTSIHNKKAANGGEAVVHLLRAAAPVLRSIAEKDRTPAIADKVCEALRSACQYLPDSRIPEFYNLFAEVIALCMSKNAATACALAKTLVLVTHSNSLIPQLRVTIADWAAYFNSSFSSDEEVDEWLALMQQIFKKEWKIISGDEGLARNIVENTVNLSLKALSSSAEPMVVKLAAQLLALLVEKTTLFDSEFSRNILKDYGERIVKIVFHRVQTDLMRQTVEALAEVLFYFAKEFPTATRSCIAGEENGGNTPMISSMFREAGNLRNFKQMTLRLNLHARKD